MVKCSICNQIELENHDFESNLIYDICHNCMEEGSEYYSDYMLRATFDTQYQEHDGYCSGADIHTKNYTKTKVIPLTKLIKQEDMDEEGNIDPSCKYLNYYNRQSGCNGSGSGHCYSVNYTKITRAKIVKKKRNKKNLIRLLDITHTTKK